MEGHQPQVIPTRCKKHSRAGPEVGQGCSDAENPAICALFITHVWTCQTCYCLCAPYEGTEPPSQGRDSPSRVRFRPPHRRTFRFRVLPTGRLRPTGVPCSAHAAIYAEKGRRIKGTGDETTQIAKVERKCADRHVVVTGAGTGIGSAIASGSRKRRGVTCSGSTRSSKSAPRRSRPAAMRGARHA